MSSYLSAMPINKLQMQVSVRSYSKCYYIWTDFSVLAKKHKLVLNWYLINYVASLEDIFIFFKLFNNCRSHNKCCSPRPPVKIYVSLECLLFALLKTDAPKLFLYCPLYVLDTYKENANILHILSRFMPNFWLKFLTFLRGLTRLKMYKPTKIHFV